MKTVVVAPVWLIGTCLIAIVSMPINAQHVHESSSYAYSRVPSC